MSKTKLGGILCLSFLFPTPYQKLTVMTIPLTPEIDDLGVATTTDRIQPGRISDLLHNGPSDTIQTTMVRDKRFLVNDLTTIANGKPEPASKCATDVTFSLRNLKCESQRSLTLQEVLLKAGQIHPMADKIIKLTKQRSFIPPLHHSNVNIPSLVETNNAAVFLEKLLRNMMIYYKYLSMMVSYEDSRRSVLVSDLADEVRELQVKVRNTACSLGSYLGRDTVVDTSSLQCLMDIATFVRYQSTCVTILQNLLRDVDMVGTISP